MSYNIIKIIDNNIRCTLWMLLIMLISSISAYGQSSNEVLQYLVSIDCKYPNIVTSQAILETGHFKSYGCRERNNLFGLWNHSRQKFYEFDSWRDSCDAYLRMVQYKYKGGDYYVFLSEMGYASDPEYTNKLRVISSGSK